ncbi:ABC transporter substrate-binding protein [Clostridium cellulovorans]|uniref:Extracellular solute-binding protein family 3 n=1 Tax=Clostridium cellulovorans (strain ATCC 35296 / DSM 3052 / OCM 3 / 743B) TaxID=573061 RepID=D9SUS8_CLOC7|nr:ABC transporter substrate-binding protein [Clostridium cellulovorans]ADL50983.1 extracellular solute-binding protein family 3 [Clostridium cellulovorans 743B]
MFEDVLKKTLIFILIGTFAQIFIIHQTKTINAENLSAGDTNDRLALIKERGVINVLSSNDPPIAYIDPVTKEFTGVDGEIIHEIARRLGIKKVKMEEVPFENLLTELNTNDNADMAASSIYVNEERKKQVLFTNIIYKESEAIVTPRVSKFTFKEDLKNATLGVQLGTVYSELVQKWYQENLIKAVKYYNTQNELLKAVNTGKVDACMTDSIVSSYLLSTDTGLYLKPMDGYKPELAGLTAIALKKSDVALANEINKKIDEMKKDRTLMSILSKYGMGTNNFVSVEDGHIYNNTSKRNLKYQLLEKERINQ